jgi:hypothetical protein
MENILYMPRYYYHKPALRVPEGRTSKILSMLVYSHPCTLPLVILIREFHKLELTWALAPFLLGSYFIGQFLGKRIYKLIPFRKKQFSCFLKNEIPVGFC